MKKAYLKIFKGEFRNFHIRQTTNFVWEGRIQKAEAVSSLYYAMNMLIVCDCSSAHENWSNLQQICVI